MFGSQKQQELDAARFQLIEMQKRVKHSCEIFDSEIERHKKEYLSQLFTGPDIEADVLTISDKLDIGSSGFEFIQLLYLQALYYGKWAMLTQAVDQSFLETKIKNKLGFYVSGLSKEQHNKIISDMAMRSQQIAYYEMKVSHICKLLHKRQVYVIGDATNKVPVTSTISV